MISELFTQGSALFDPRSSLRAFVRGVTEALPEPVAHSHPVWVLAPCVMRPGSSGSPEGWRLRVVASLPGYLMPTWVSDTPFPLP